jgi:hypothetical protein
MAPPPPLPRRILLLPLLVPSLALALRPLSTLLPPTTTSPSPPSWRSPPLASVAWTRAPTPFPGGAVLTDVHVIARDGRLLGYASGELGLLLKLNASLDDPDSANATWEYALNRADDTYLYGVYAFPDGETVLTVGFLDGAGKSEGLIQYSRDGARTFEPIVFLDADWANGPIYFPDGVHGIFDGISLSSMWIANGSTPGGGTNASAWTPVQSDPVNEAWHAGDYVALPSGFVKVVGASDCESTDFGRTWACTAPVDPDADGGIQCGEGYCAMGGGEISPAVAGWAHVSADNGKTWTQRALSCPFPIRTTEVVPAGGGPRPLLIAAGGNYFSAVGGIYSSADGGVTWSHDLDTGGEEIKSCRGLALPGTTTTRLYCVGAGQASAGVFVADIKGQ